MSRAACGGGDVGVLSCEGADAAHLFFANLLVNSSSGASLVPPSYNTFQACMTPHCSLLATVGATGGGGR